MKTDKDIVDALEKLARCITLKNYSQATRKSYIGCTRRYFQVYPTDLQQPHEAHCETFLLRLFEDGASSQTVQTYLQAIQFYYREVLNRSVAWNIKTPKRPKRLPVTLTHNEIERILEAVSNEKHRTMIALAYGAGLRISELTDLRVGSVDVDGGILRIYQGKGQKDRLSLLPPSLVSTLQKRILGKRPFDYVFESERGGRLSS